ncbi:glycosyltransferase [Paenibacillus alginolyticus]|uniref:glycosyltransferase family 2 protein n=1 Tax=Paenibacillus alginolyticus TaxID=59839 RepID=UPI000408B4F4|nr:glycosyltransferase [Paenibacillus alginolyticus]MCY9667095.1 glycosyltransferase [Paenibacillus alginolyticus]
MARVTVLMPVYNVSLYIDESISSILQQTFQDFEFLIIDDGSTDGTLEKIQKYHDSRIKLIVHSTNMGLVESLNQGISLSTGDYIARMDGDDVSLPRRLERQVAFMDLNQHIGVCGGQAQFMGKNQITRAPLSHEEIRCFQLFHCTFAHPSVIFRKSIIDTYGVRYFPYKHAEDYDIWNRLADFTQLTNLPEVLIILRQHSNQVSVASKWVQDRNADAIRMYQLHQLDLYPTEEEYRLHLDFSDFKIRVHDFVHYSNCLAWAHKILEANYKKQKYDHETLNRVLSQFFSLSEVN